MHGGYLVFEARIRLNCRTWDFGIWDFLAGAFARGCIVYSSLDNFALMQAAAPSRQYMSFAFMQS